jgi:hypothetical protein
MPAPHPRRLEDAMSKSPVHEADPAVQQLNVLETSGYAAAPNFESHRFPLNFALFCRRR